MLLTNQLVAESTDVHDFDNGITVQFSSGPADVDSGVSGIEEFSSLHNFNKVVLRSSTSLWLRCSNVNFTESKEK